MGKPARISASANGLYRPNPRFPPGAGQSSQMSPVTVIVTNPCSRLAVPVIVVILLSW